MKTSYFLVKNNLKSFFRPGWKGMGDPGVEEVETRQSPELPIDSNREKHLKSL